MGQPMNDALVSLLVSLLPLLIVTLILFVFSIPIARRKGKSFIYPLLCMIPFVTPFVLFYLASLTDKQILERLAALERNAAR
jgi:hypothetical protein